MSDDVTGCIHETAIVDPLAKLGSEVNVGPYSIVEKDVEVGDGCLLEAHSILKKGTRLGSECRVGNFAVLGGDPQYLAFDPEISSSVVVGRGTRIGEGVTVHRSINQGGETIVGEQVFLMGYSHVAHDCLVGDHVSVANGCLLAGHVELGDHAFLGGGAAFHQFVRVGEGAMVGGMAEVSADVPPFLLVTGRNIASGLNLVGLKRRGFSAEEIGDLKACFRSVYGREGNVREHARKALLDEELVHTSHGRKFLEFFLKGDRGFAKLRKNLGNDAA